MEEPKKENRLFNVLLLGDITSDKKEILEHYILNNSQEKNQSEESNSENNQNNNSEMTQSIEIHGETIKMKILEDSETDQIFQSEEEISNQPQGLILFYSVTERESFDKLKKLITKLLEMNKEEMPIVIVGNISENSERKISYDEAKNLADKYGLKYHEISKENNCINMKDVFNDLGEQILYEDFSKKKEKEKNNINKHIKSPNMKLTDENIKYKSNSKSKGDSSYSKEKKTLIQKRREEEVREKRKKREQEMQLWYKKREQESIELKKKKAIEDKIKLKEKIKEDKIIQKKREKEVKEEFLNQNKERYERTKKEKEEGEKKNTFEKEKNKKLLEQRRKSEKENIKKLMQENEQNEKEYLRKQREKINSPQTMRKSRQKKNLEASMDENMINKTISDFKYSVESKNNNFPHALKKNKTIGNFFNPKNSNSSKKNNEKEKEKDKINNNKLLKSKSIRRAKNSSTKLDENLEKIKEKEMKEKLEKKEQEEKIIQEKTQMKNDIKEKYLNNSNIYRCLYCSNIPIFNINEFNHQIEIFCHNCKNKNNNRDYYISSYNNFEKKSIDHPLDNNISCIYCNKNLNELINENIYLNFCDICNEIICSKDKSVHINEKHIKNKELKDMYKNLSNKEEKNKNIRRKSSSDIKNSSSKLQSNSKKNQTHKNLEEEKKKTKEDNKSSNIKKNEVVVGNKNTNKKINEKKKNNTNINNDGNINKISNSNINKIKEEKLPLYLNDSFCIEHGEIYNSFCHDCLKNICEICEENEHKAHNKQNLSSMMVDEEKLLKIKQSLEKDINDLNNINIYFEQLIENIKKQFKYFYSLKQKEIEIKQKIIKDYEVIKYNYNCIQNINNINSSNINTNKNSIISNLNKLNNDNNDNNKDLLYELNLIFNYFNESLQSTDLSKYYNNSNKFLISNNQEEITNIIKLDTNDIAVSLFNGCINIYDNNSFSQKLSCKVFENNKGVNNMIQLKNGDIACAGYELIKIVNINLEDKKYYISKELEIKNSSFNLIQELRNNYLITYDTDNNLKLWRNYKLIYEDNIINIDYILKITDSSFITSSTNDKELNIFNLINDNIYDNIQINSHLLENISITKGKNSIIKLNNNYLVVLYEEKENNIVQEDDNNEDVINKFEEYKNNEEYIINNGNGIYLIEINPKYKLKIVQKLKNKNGIYINAVKYINDSVLILNDMGFIQLWNFDETNKKMTIINQFKALEDNYTKIIRSIIFIEENKKIIFETYKNIICLSHE